MTIDLPACVRATLLFVSVAGSACGAASSEANTNTEPQSQASEARDEPAADLVVAAAPVAPRPVETGRVGVFDATMFDRLLATRVVALRGCYARAIATEPSLRTSVEVQCVVRETGMVTDVLAVGDPPNAEVTECVQQLLSGFRFEPGPEGGPVPLETVIVFDQR